MAPKRRREEAGDWSPAIARWLIFRFLALWMPVSIGIIFGVTFLLTPAYNAMEVPGVPRPWILYGAPSVILGAGLSYLFWHRFTDQAGYFSWMLTWTAMAAVSVVAFTGVFASHLVRPLDGSTRWILPAGILGVVLLSMVLQYLTERR